MPSISVEVQIDRSPEAIWSYFQEPQHWEKWGGAKLKAADWKQGGELLWEAGGRYLISSISPKESVCFGAQYSSGWSESITFTFNPVQNGKASIVRVDKNYAGVDFSDGGASRRQSSKDDLLRLKSLIEVKSTCFIATAAYGSPLSPAVVHLRDFRDSILLSSPKGRALVCHYERLSPPIAAFISVRPWFRFIVRHTIIFPLLLIIKIANPKRAKINSGGK